MGYPVKHNHETNECMISQFCIMPCNFIQGPNTTLLENNFSDQNSSLHLKICDYGYMSSSEIDGHFGLELIQLRSLSCTSTFEFTIPTVFPRCMLCMCIQLFGCRTCLANRFFYLDFNCLSTIKYVQ